MEYATQAIEEVRNISIEATSLLSKIENFNSDSKVAIIIDKIEIAFQKYLEYVISVKDKLLARLSKPSLNPTSSFANQLCGFAEQTNVIHINFKKAMINNDFMEIRKFSTIQNIKQLKEKLKYYDDNINKTHVPIPKGFEVIFKEPVVDPDQILSEIGISLVGYKET